MASRAEAKMDTCSLSAAELTAHPFTSAFIPTSCPSKRRSYRTAQSDVLLKRPCQNSCLYIHSFGALPVTYIFHGLFSDCLNWNSGCGENWLQQPWASSLDIQVQSLWSAVWLGVLISSQVSVAEWSIVPSTLRCAKKLIFILCDDNSVLCSCGKKN